MTDEPKIVDKRSGRGKADFTDEATYRKNPNRLSNLRWAVGQEPDGVATHPDDPWINLVIDPVEAPDPDPDQRDMLGGGPQLRMPCFHCGEPLHAAASLKAKDLLEAGGFKIPEDMALPAKAEVVACVCRFGHVTQMRRDFVERLITTND